MFMIKCIGQLWDTIYDCLTIWGKLLFLPSMLLIFPVMFALAVVEIVTIDVIWIPLICHSEGFYLRRWKHYVWYLMH